MLTLELHWRDDGPAARLVLREGSGAKWQEEVELSALLRLAIALAERRRLPEARLLELVDEIFLLRPCRALFDGLGRSEGVLLVVSGDVELTRVGFAWSSSRVERRPVPEPQATPSALAVQGRRLVARLALGAALIALSYLSASPTVWLERLSAPVLLALAKERSAEGPAGVGLLLVKPAPVGQRNNREWMRDALRACAAAGPAWIAVDVPWERARPSDEVLWDEVDRWSASVPLIVGVGEVDGSHLDLEGAAVLRADWDPQVDPRRRIALDYAASRGSERRLPALAIEMARRLAASDASPILVFTSVNTRRELQAWVPLILPASGLSEGRLPRVRWPDERAEISGLCAPGRGVVLAFEDWAHAGPPNERDLHPALIAGEASAVGEWASVDAGGPLLLPGPVVQVELAEVLAYGPRYLPWDLAIHQWFDIPAPVEVGSAGSPGPAVERRAVVSFTTSTFTSMCGSALYLSLLTVPWRLLRVVMSRPRRRLALVLSLQFTLAILCVRGAEVLLPIAAGSLWLLCLLVGATRLESAQVESETIRALPSAGEGI